LQALRVLVIDDEPDVLDAMGRTLRTWGCVVRVASTGDEATSVNFNGQAPDVVLCDLNLSGTERGIDVVMRLHAHWGVRLCTVFITAEMDPERLQEARQSCDHLLAKPVKPAKLRALLEAIASEPPAVPK
jgi:CheY-like chemotaxis protein